jgi:hypothetical protein
MTVTVGKSKLGIDSTEPSPPIRGRCCCGHWACFHRAAEFADIDPCRLCLCGYFEDGLDVPPAVVLHTPRRSLLRFVETDAA